MKSAERIFGAGRAIDPLKFGRQAKPAPKHDPMKARLIQKVQIARIQLKLIDDDYRGILLRIAGVTSSTKATVPQLLDVLKHFEASGWKSAPPAGKRGKGKPASFPGAVKARALWISLHQLGAIDDPSEAALEAFACRQLGCVRFQWANQTQLDRLIEAEKAMAKRMGWDQSTKGLDPAMVVIVLKRRLIERQMAMLAEADWIPREWHVTDAAYKFGGVEIAALITATDRELDMVAQALGRAINDAKAAGAKW